MKTRHATILALAGALGMLLAVVPTAFAQDGSSLSSRETSSRSFRQNVDLDRDTVLAAIVLDRAGGFGFGSGFGSGFGGLGTRQVFLTDDFGRSRLLDDPFVFRSSRTFSDPFLFSSDPFLFDRGFGIGSSSSRVTDSATISQRVDIDPEDALLFIALDNTGIGGSSLFGGDFFPGSFSSSARQSSSIRSTSDLDTDDVLLAIALDR